MFLYTEESLYTMSAYDLKFAVSDMLDSLEDSTQEANRFTTPGSTIVEMNELSEGIDRIKYACQLWEQRSNEESK